MIACALVPLNPNELTPASRGRASVWPRLPGRRHLEPVVGPGDMPARRVEMQMWRNPFVLQGQHHLDHAGDAGRRLEVADIGLDRADQQRIVGGSSGAERVRERADFDRIAERGAGAVGFDIADRGRLEPGIGERGADHRLLRRTVRHGQAAAAAVLVDGGAADDGEYLVAVGLRVGKTLQHDDTAALAAREAVGLVGKGLAAAVGRQHVRLGQCD